MNGLMADKIHRTHFPMKLKSPMSEPEKEQTWDFFIFIQVPVKALTAATTVPPGALAKKRQVCEPKLCRTCLFIRKLTLHAILTFICFELAVFSGRNLHARAHSGSQGDAL